MRKPRVVFSIMAFLVAAFFVAGLALAAGQQWISGNFRYTKTARGVEVTEINRPAQNASSTTVATTSTFARIRSANAQFCPASQFTNIISVASIHDIDVAYGTVLSSMNLPATVTVTMSDGSTKKVPVLWNGGAPAYDPTTAGTYAFSGLPVIFGNLTNTNGVKAKVDVVVASSLSENQQSAADSSAQTSPSQSSVDSSSSVSSSSSDSSSSAADTSSSQALDVVSVAPISDINVAYGTASSSLGFAGQYCCYFE